MLQAQSVEARCEVQLNSSTGERTLSTPRERKNPKRQTLGFGQGDTWKRHVTLGGFLSGPQTKAS